MTQDYPGFLSLDKHSEVKLKGTRKDHDFYHQFDKEQIDAINTAIACSRPLLLTGEPGVGKTQLARATAAVLGRAYVRGTVDAKSEARDLLWQFDTVARLADAQLAQTLGWSEHDCKQKLDPANYLLPGPLWWGLNWYSASKRPRAKMPGQIDDERYRRGVVVLIDEIDKAEIDVPNGLLEVLGEGSFHPEGLDEPVVVDEIAPLVVITSNRERALPDAFVRRCVVNKIELPGSEEDLRNLLVKRGLAHFRLPDEKGKEMEEVMLLAAKMLIEDRNKVSDGGTRPGLAEYLDLLHAVDEQRDSGISSTELMEWARPYLLRKRDSL